MTKKLSLILKIIIAISILIVGYILFSNPFFIQPKPILNTTEIKKEYQQIKIDKDETEFLPPQNEIEITDVTSDIGNAPLPKYGSNWVRSFPYGEPDELYIKHIKLAEDGIPESQFYTYQALHQCSRAPQSYEALIKSQERRPQYSLNRERRFKKCEKLAEILNKNTTYANRSFKELADMWKDIAFDNEYPLAISSKIMFGTKRGDYIIEEARTALQNTIKLERYEGYNHVVNYYLRQRNLENNFSRNHSLAWIALTCDANPACSISEHLKGRQWNLPSSDYNKLNETFESIKDSIERKAWSELEIFEEPSPN